MSIDNAIAYIAQIANDSLVKLEQRIKSKINSNTTRFYEKVTEPIDNMLALYQTFG